MGPDLKRYLPVFIQAASDLSFSEAARKLGVTSAAVSKAIRTLEEGLGTQLFYRSTHALTLTDDGERLYRRTATHLERIDEALHQVQSLPDRPQGKVRVSASYAFARQFIVPLLGGFHERYPDVELDLFFDDQVRDLVKDQIDLGIGGRLDPGGNLVMKKLCDGSVSFVASAGFLKKHGTPTHPRDLMDYSCIRFRSHSSGDLMPWAYVDEAGDRALFHPPAKIVVSSQELLCDLAAQGLGVAMTGLVAQPYIKAGELVPILRKWAISPPPISIYYSSKTNLPSKVRVFIDHIVEHMQDPAYWELPRRAR